MAERERSFGDVARDNADLILHALRNEVMSAREDCTTAGKVVAGLEAGHTHPLFAEGEAGIRAAFLIQERHAKRERDAQELLDELEEAPGGTW